MNDPIKVIISDFIETVKITDEQREFLKNSSKSDKIILDNILILLAKMEKDKVYDEDTLKLIEKSIRNLKG